MRTGTIERAYEVARSGRAGNIDDVIGLLTREGYFNAKGQLRDPVLKDSIATLCTDARRPKLRQGQKGKRR